MKTNLKLSTTPTKPDFANARSASEGARMISPSNLLHFPHPTPISFIITITRLSPTLLQPLQRILFFHFYNLFMPLQEFTDSFNPPISPLFWSLCYVLVAADNEKMAKQ
jgi:hypothetical protein